ncbi:MAG: hypothetical protein JW749_00370 [Sedimentisphaerales bacterium]|nr:hypothetical protein [Sedimentisphaerales bacterium]
MKRVLLAAGIVVISLFCFIHNALSADGWASQNGGTTGGEEGEVIPVDNAIALETYAEMGTTPYIIQISGTINISDTVEIRANKTLIGVGENPTLVGQLGFENDEGNIIIENLNITNPPPGVGDGDGIRLAQNIYNVLITKCSIYHCDDGCLDITNNSDFVTVSWCKFYYTSDTTHNYANLIGASDKQDDDAANLRVTFHHNWWTTLCKERMPRVRYGQVHVYNNYYSNLMAGGYCIGVGCGSRIRVESNYFNTVSNPWANYYTGQTDCHSDGHIGWNTGNIFYNCTQPTWATNEYDTIFTPPYSYTLDDAAVLPTIVPAFAGAGTPYPPHWYYTVYGDFDIDETVNMDDLDTFADYWLTDADEADFDYDGIVNLYEFSHLAENWMQ